MRRDINGKTTLREDLWDAVAEADTSLKDSLAHHFEELPECCKMAFSVWNNALEEWADADAASINVSLN